MKNEIQRLEQPEMPVTRPLPTPAEILQTAIQGGITKENVEVVKELAAMCREQRAEDARALFAKAFFRLRKEMPVIYADKEVTTKSGAVAFQYCTPAEIKDVLEPLMQKHGFCTMTGQTLSNGEVTATVTLIHEGGHSETRSFTVRVSPGNQLMSPSQCDAAATTAAERHALIKMFGLRTRQKVEDDPRNVGEPITAEQAEELQHRMKMLNAPEQPFLKWAGVPNAPQHPALDDYKKIPSTAYDRCDQFLSGKEAGR